MWTQKGSGVVGLASFNGIEVKYGKKWKLEILRSGVECFIQLCESFWTDAKVP